MRILLDTHIALWAIADTTKLSEQVIELLESEKNEVFYSVASIGKLQLSIKLNQKICLYQRKNLLNCVRILDLSNCL